MSQTTAGSFPSDPNFSTFTTQMVGAEVSPANTYPTRRMSGFIRTAQLVDQPTVTQAWTILGWSVRARLVASANVISAGAPLPAWAQLGDLWCGLMLDANLQNAGGTAPSGVKLSGNASFPQDLSTFGKLWSGGSDPVAFLSDSQVLVGAGLTDPDCSLLGLTYMLPSPVRARSGAQLQMATILTPSITNGVSLFLRSMDFSLIYDT